MGIIAYTLVQTEHGKAKKFVSKVEKLQFVKEITSVYGEYDIIVKTETETIKELTIFIYNRLRPISGLTMTTTMITAKLQK